MVVDLTADCRSTESAPTNDIHLGSIFLETAVVLTLYF
jgi:hypothetical protein